MYIIFYRAYLEPYSLRNQFSKFTLVCVANLHFEPFMTDLLKIANMHVYILCDTMMKLLVFYINFFLVNLNDSC